MRENKRCAKFDGIKVISLCGNADVAIGFLSKLNGKIQKSIWNSIFGSKFKNKNQNDIHLIIVNSNQLLI